MARITFCLTLGLGFVFTVWLHLPYLPGLKRLPFFGWIGTILSFFEGTPSSGNGAQFLTSHIFLGTPPSSFLWGGVGAENGVPPFPPSLERWSWVGLC